MEIYYHYPLCSIAKEQYTYWIAQRFFTGLQKKSFISPVLFKMSKSHLKCRVICHILKTTHHIKNVCTPLYEHSPDQSPKDHDHEDISGHYLLLFIRVGYALGGLFTSRGLVTPGKMIIIIFGGLGLLFQNG